MCNPEQMDKIMKKTNKIMDARRQRETWLAECREKARERKEKKILKQTVSPVSSRSVSPHSDRRQTNGDTNPTAGGISTDEEEIDEKIHILWKRLETKLVNPSKTVEKNYGQNQRSKKLLKSLVH